MNSEDWLKKYYPKPPSSRMTKRQAIEHSLKKWEGLRPAVLKKHGLIKQSRRIYDQEVNFVLQIDDRSCALCVKFILKGSSVKLGFCAKCPLAQHLGKPCDQGEDSPYVSWLNTGNPNKMIKALKALLEEK